jgi:broad specificity phosphatase PhoE
MKVHKRKNLVFSKELLDEFFDITNVNHNHLSFFKDINNRKSKKKIYLKREDIAKLKSFLAEYKNAYDTMFVKGVRKITFLRHQKTPMNIEGVFFGQRHDISIDPILDEKILSSLRDIVNDVDFIYSSSLKRAIETAGAVNSEAKKEIIINSALNELDYGLADGKDYGYLKKNHPDLIKAWAERKDPRFPEGENYADLIARLDKFFATLKSKDFHKALVVTHNVLLRVVIGRILGIPKHLWFKIHVGNLEHFEVILANNGNMYLDASPEFLRKIYMDVYTK